MPRPQIGFTRGRVYFPIRNEDGSIAGFVGYADGQLKMPPQWIGTNVVKLKRAKKRPRSSRGFFYLAVRFGFGVDAGVAPTAASVEVGGAFEPRIPSPDIEPAALLPAPPVAPAALLRTPPVPPAGAPVCADEAVLMRAKQVTKPIAEIFMVSLR
jgi:hypothetical protein